MNTIRHLRSILAPAIAAARATLRSLDDKEVPARLRPVARRGDGKLPLPLTRTLLLRIDEDDWFRAKALEAFEHRGSEDALSRSYLAREPGWWIVVAEAVAHEEVEAAAARIEQLQRDLDTARTRAGADRAKAKAIRRELTEAENTARASVEERLEPLRATATAARAERDRMREELGAALQEVASATADRLEAEHTAAVLSEQLRSAKRTAAQIRRSAESGTSESVPRQPMDIARWLDRASASLAPYREAVAVTTATRRGAETGRALIPAGIAPDSPAAIEGLSGIDGATVLVDGHNVLGVLNASTMATGRARRSLIASLGRLTRHLGDSTIEVVFDSDLDEGRSRTVSDTGIIVRFAQGDLIADDVIVERAARLREAAIVVSDDREVRDRCTDYGATLLWAQALARWL
ncbi:MAG: NYN domain-containing protein [Acidimicrobiia bacterium]